MRTDIPFKQYQKTWCRNCKYKDKCIGSDENCAITTDTEAGFLTYMLMVQNTILMCRAETKGTEGKEYAYHDIIKIGGQ